MCIVEELKENIKYSFCESIHDKLVFISGYLANDEEYEDIFNLVNYLLYSEKISRSSFSLTPSLFFELLRDMCSGDNNDK